MAGTISITRRDSVREVVQAAGFALAIGACLVFGLGLAWRSAPTDVSGYGSRIEDTVNPNTAPWASLIRLPGIGPARAAAILAYRDRFIPHGPETVAFGCPEDLAQVEGIGPATVDEIRPWLRFDPPVRNDAPVRRDDR